MAICRPLEPHDVFHSPSSASVVAHGVSTAPSENVRARSDTLLSSVALLLVMTIVLRGVGFLRSILLCRWLDPEQLGQWDLALGFLELAAPVAVLGIPGSFGRYVQRYLQRGQFGSFLRQTTLVSAGLALCAALMVLLGAANFSELIFGTADNANVVRLLSLSLLALVAHYFLITVMTGLLRNRLAYRQEVVQSLSFTLLAVALVGGFEGDATSLVAAYTIACLVAVSMGVLCLRDETRLVLAAGEPLPAKTLWPALLPFSLWVWGTNWLSNLFDLADRAMLVHFSGLTNQQSLELVGNYHSARIVPLLLVTVTSSLATMLTPYLSRDWEAGQRDEVSMRLNLFVKVLGWGLTAGAVVIMWLAPWLFQIALNGKYGAGQSVLPWTLTYCVWFGMARVAQKYLWCVERVGLAATAWAVGLAVNIALNVYLLPRYGLPGVVLATSAGNFASLLLIQAFNVRHGLRMVRGVPLALALPLVVHFGPAPAAAALIVTALVGCSTSYLLSLRERRLLADTLAGLIDRCLARWSPSQAG